MITIQYLLRAARFLGVLAALALGTIASAQDNPYA
jgi:hypothetical protein